jgi:RNA polymerase sigma-70 factor (ECF subfamily)
VSVVGTDQREFGDLLEQHRGELRVHCYRMLGSLDDAEDLVQETFLRAWRYRHTYTGRSTIRAWLYRIATNACLDQLTRHPRRPREAPAPPGVAPALAAQPAAEIQWLQPYPDSLLDPPTPDAASPDMTVVAKETIELAYLAVIQHLPPRQRAVLILRDVLGWSAAEVADLLGGSVPAVKSALQRARATLKQRLPRRREEWPTEDPTGAERALLQRYIAAHEQADVDALAQLLADDVRLAMPPHPYWFAGRDAVLQLTAQVFDPTSTWYHGRFRAVPTRANRQPAVAQYVERPSAEETKNMREGEFRAQVLDVLRVENGQIVEITAFEPAVFPAFGLPLVL